MQFLPIFDDIENIVNVHNQFRAQQVGVLIVDGGRFLFRVIVLAVLGDHIT